MSSSPSSPVYAPTTTAPVAPPLRLAIFGTHPQQYNGYSKVVYELICELARLPDVRVFVFGFQRSDNKEGRRDSFRPDVPSNVVVYDAMADEHPKASGFGIGMVKSFVATCQPDVAMVFNDMSVLCAVVNELKDVPDRRFKILAYVDQVYLCQKKQYIGFLNRHADAAIAFTPSWQRCIRDQGLSVACHYLPHGLNTRTYFPVPTGVARRYFGFGQADFLILNMNRNQPRKRWDTCLKAFAELLVRQPDPNIKLVIGTASKGGWDLREVFERECQKRGITSEQGERHLIFTDTPQRMSDREVNLMYNACDVGVNMCDGEGFGLCNFEHAAVGKPQAVTRLGAFPDIFDDSCAELIDPKVALYLDNSRDSVGGEALVCDYVDFTDALETYYLDPRKRAVHGTRCRRNILRDYRWSDIAAKLTTICKDTVYGGQSGGVSVGDPQGTAGDEIRKGNDDGPSTMTSTTTNTTPPIVKNICEMSLEEADAVMNDASNSSSSSNTTNNVKLERCRSSSSTSSSISFDSPEVPEATTTETKENDSGKKKTRKEGETERETGAAVHEPTDNAVNAVTTPPQHPHRQQQQRQQQIPGLESLAAQLAALQSSVTALMASASASTDARSTEHTNTNTNDDDDENI